MTRAGCKVLSVSLLGAFLVVATLGCRSKSKEGTTEAPVVSLDSPAAREATPILESDYLSEASTQLKLLRSSDGSPANSDARATAMSRLEVLPAPTELQKFHDSLIEQIHVQFAKGKNDPIATRADLIPELVAAAEEAKIDLNQLVSNSSIQRTR